MIGYNVDLHIQVKQLEKIILSNKIIANILEKASKFGFDNYYIGAGCIVQTVWNFQMNYDLTNGISDIDFVYYDSSDMSLETENSITEKIEKEFNELSIKLDINNQARVHLWYKEHFGYDIEPYKSIEDAINSWPTTATSIGVRLDEQKMKIYSPYGLNDLFGMIVRPNKKQITEEIYLQKVNKWKTKWPSLTIIPW
jgi:hypothetical protein